MTVTTVLGDVDPEALGLTLPHEHLLMSQASFWRAPQQPDQLLVALGEHILEARGAIASDPNLIHDNLVLDSTAVALEELSLFQGVGGRTIFELSSIGLRRDPEGLTGLARASGINIVMGTGYYVQAAQPTWVSLASVDQLAEEMIHELTVGIGHSGIRAGIIGEIGCGSPMAPDEAKVMKAVARAHAETGAVVNMHRSSYPDEFSALEGIDLLLAQGVDASRLIVSHCDERPTSEFALRVADRGVIVELDTWGMEAWARSWPVDGDVHRAATDTDRLALLTDLLARGLEDRILLSHDVCSKAQLTRFGGFGYAHLSRTIEPLLRAHAVTDRQIHKMRVANICRIMTEMSH